MIPAQCKRLIEVEFPIRMISRNARQEKSIPHGHISTLHIWWARRPLASCRAITLGALLPDPVDPRCPVDFKKRALELLRPLLKKPEVDDLLIRTALLEFITDFSSWQKSNDIQMINIARSLVKVSYSGEQPLLIDPFAGGGAIPLEALRIGAEAFATEINPVALLILKSMLEDIPRYGQKILKCFESYANWIKERAQKELDEIYPADPDGALPIAYIWARTIKCEGPGCGAEIPLMRQNLLARRGRKLTVLEIKPDKKSKFINLSSIITASDISIEGTVRNASATCPVCNYTTPAQQVHKQLKLSKGGARNARLIAVVSSSKGDFSKRYRIPNEHDYKAIHKAEEKLSALNSMLPNELLNPIRPSKNTIGVSRASRIGIETFGDLFTARQSLFMLTVCKLIPKCNELIEKETGDKQFARAVSTLLAFALDRVADYNSSFCCWAANGEFIGHTFSRQSLAIVWDFAEINPFSGYTGCWDSSVNWIKKVLRHLIQAQLLSGRVQQASATQLPLPDSLADVVITDPPYYDAIPYSDIADYFYVWLKRNVGPLYPELFKDDLSPKDQEIIVTNAHRFNNQPKGKEFFESRMILALSEARRVLKPDGVAVIIFSHASTEGWEAILNALLRAGWCITASWPIDTELPTRLRAQGAASLQSSIHLVCRPRAVESGTGDWRDVLRELQPKVNSWMRRLVKEGIVGADAIFACIGPALEIFSRYDKIETAGGKRVELKEYLEHIWEAVAKEALNMIFEGAEPTGFEEDARLSALWLWTLRTSTESINEKEKTKLYEEEKESKGKVRGYLLEYDTARKIAQGLGAHLEELCNPGGIVEIKGNIATLLFVTERRELLFQEPSELRRIPEGQTTLFGGPVSESLELKTVSEIGRTTLDRLHQAMLLFGDGRSEALRRFLVDEGVGKDDRFWHLAQALSALYPRNSEEKRGVEGVLSRKKSLGF